MHKYLLYSSLLSMYAIQAAFTLADFKSLQDDVMQQTYNAATVSVWQLGGYFFLGSTLFKGKRFEDPNPSKQLAQAVQNYKIHLMPHRQDAIALLRTLYASIAQNRELQDNLNQIKVAVDYEQALAQGKPIIVVYPASGKESAQIVLDALVVLLKDIPGNGRTLPFNRKINDLIFVAQGDSNYKTQEWFTHLYEPDKVYFKSDVTGSYQDYHLNNPLQSHEDDLVATQPLDESQPMETSV